MRVFLGMAFGICVMLAEINVVVSVAPQEYFIKAIAKDRAKVSIMVPQGIVPETFEPSPKEAQIIQKAHLFFGVGMDYEEEWIKRFSTLNASLRYINLADKILSKNNENYTKSDIHTHHDPHIWISLNLAQMQAQEICDVFIKLDSAYKDFYMQNLNDFLVQIAVMQTDFKQIFLESHTKTFIVIHPGFGYLAKEFGLREVALELDGKETKTKRLDEIVRLIRKENIKRLFSQPQFDPATINQIASMLGLEVVILDPLRADWADNMYEIARKIAYQ